MGRIKSLMVKNAAKQLLDSDLEFNESFEKNKKILKDTMPSKPIRNKIAGYIARLKKMQKNPRKIKKLEQEDGERSEQQRI